MNIFGGMKILWIFLGGLGPKITCITGSEFGVITKLYYI